MAHSYLLALKLSDFIGIIFWQKTTSEFDTLPQNQTDLVSILALTDSRHWGQMNNGVNMSDNDQVLQRKKRSPINAVKLLNLLREEKGLPKVLTKVKVTNGKKRLTKQEKNDLAKQIWKDLFPAWDTPAFQLPENAEKSVMIEFDRRVRDLQGDPARRGRKPKVVVE